MDIEYEPPESELFVIEEAPERELLVLPDLHPFWWVYLGLLFASLIGTLAVLPFSASLFRQAMPNGLPPEMLPALLVGSVVIELVLSAVAIGLGLLLGRKIGLEVPASDRAQVGTGTTPALRSTLVLATVLGIAVGVFDLVLAQALDGFKLQQAAPAAFTMPPPWECLLASVGAAIREEIWLRLGCLTFLAFLGTKLCWRNRPPTAVIWFANLSAALLFGVMHIPQTNALIGLSAPVLAYVLIGNGVPGLVFGWLFWRKGLLAAMVAHFWLDVVLKIIAPLLFA